MDPCNEILNLKLETYLISICCRQMVVQFWKFSITGTHFIADKANQHEIRRGLKAYKSII